MKNWYGAMEPWMKTKVSKCNLTSNLYKKILNSPLIFSKKYVILWVSRPSTQIRKKAKKLSPSVFAQKQDSMRFDTLQRKLSARGGPLYSKKCARQRGSTEKFVEEKKLERNRGLWQWEFTQKLVLLKKKLKSFWEGVWGIPDTQLLIRASEFHLEVIRRLKRVLNTTIFLKAECAGFPQKRNFGQTPLRANNLEGVR